MNVRSVFELSVRSLPLLFKLLTGRVTTNMVVVLIGGADNESGGGGGDGGVH